MAPIVGDPSGANNPNLEAGFVPLNQFYLSMFYTRRQLGTRVGIWLAMAPMG